MSTGKHIVSFLWNILIDKLLGAQYPFGFKIIAYADDLVLCTYDADPAIAVYHLQTMCDATVDWGGKVKLAFNAMKTVFMIFSSRRSISLDNLSLSINNQHVKRSSQCIYLGMIFDDRLCWRAHVAAKCASVKKIVFLVSKSCRLTWGLPRKALLVLCKSSFQKFFTAVLFRAAVFNSSGAQKCCVLHKGHSPW